MPGSRGRAREKGVRSPAFPLQKHGQVPENRSQARAPRPVSEPLLCSPGRAWLEAHSGRLLESDRGCPQSTLTRGPRPLASRQGPSSRPAVSVNLQPKRGAALREFVSRKGSEPSSIGAYVHRAINRKDLQSSPGPQQPRTLSGITYDDLSHQPGQLSH